MDNDEGDDNKVPWRAVVLWIVAATVGGLASWEYSQADTVRGIREVQVSHSSHLQAHSEKFNFIDRRLEMIETTKTDKRFRSDDWDAQRKILDAEFRAVWKAIEDCRKPLR